MKVFIDLGTFNGSVLKKATQIYSDFDKFIGFEPIPALCNKARKKLTKNKKVTIYNKAVGTRSERAILYLNLYKKSKNSGLGKGSSLMKEKITGGLSKKNSIEVKVINFSEYIKSSFSKDDFIILKIDIEGKEYDLLDHLIESEAISYVDKIFCEWHHHKLSKPGSNYKERHDKIISKLRDMGFNLTGDNKKDEFSKCI